LVGYAGEETDNRIMEAGTILVPYGDRNALAERLELLLGDDRLWLELHRRNLETYARYFDWDVIARQYLDLLGVA
jgi:glycosyltransferase involved in cell wall biosynthesis